MRQIGEALSGQRNVKQLLLNYVAVERELIEGGGELDGGRLKELNGKKFRMEESIGRELYLLR